MIELDLPLNKEKIRKLKIGDNLLLNGEILVARDAAHQKIYEALKSNENLPFNLENQIIYYMGPSPTPPGKVIGAAGPTTSHRMDKFVDLMLSQGVLGFIGKGNRSKEVEEALKKYKGINLSAIGGLGALLSKQILKNEVIAYPELGPEAVRVLKIISFPVTVTIDSKGNNLYTKN